MKLKVPLLLGIIALISISSLTPPASAFTRIGALTLNSGEGNLGGAALIDSANGFAYFSALIPNPAVIVKVRLSDFTRVGALTLNAGEHDIYSGVIDTVNGFAYFGTETSPGIIVKVRLSDFTRVGNLTLQTGENSPFAAVIDTAGGYAYFATDGFPSVIVKVRLSDFTRVGSLTLNSGENEVFSAVIDTTNGFAYFATHTSPGIVVKVRLSDFTRVGAVTLSAGENYPLEGIIDSANGFAYFGISPGTSPAKIVRVHLADLTESSLTLNPGENNTWSGVMDSANGFAYYGTGIGVLTTSTIVKIRLSDFTLNASLPLNSGENAVFSAVIDSSKGFAYFGTNANPGIVVKVDVAIPSSAPTGLMVTPGANKLTLNWVAPGKTGSANITGYKIYRGTSSGTETLLTTVGGSATTYSDTSVLTGTTYFYKVTAQNRAGESVQSNEASATASSGAPNFPSLTVTIILTTATIIAARTVLKPRRTTFS